MFKAGVPYTSEELTILDQCVEDGWPLVQIKATHGVSWKTMRKYYPDYRGMDNVEAAKVGAQGRRTTLALRKHDHA